MTDSAVDGYKLSIRQVMKRLIVSVMNHYFIASLGSMQAGQQAADDWKRSGHVV